MGQQRMRKRPNARACANRSKSSRKANRKTGKAQVQQVLKDWAEYTKMIPKSRIGIRWLYNTSNLESGDACFPIIQERMNFAKKPLLRNGTKRQKRDEKLTHGKPILTHPVQSEMEMLTLTIPKLFLVKVGFNSKDSSEWIVKSENEVLKEFIGTKKPKARSRKSQPQRRRNNNDDELRRNQRVKRVQVPPVEESYLEKALKQKKGQKQEEKKKEYFSTKEMTRGERLALRNANAEPNEIKSILRRFATTTPKEREKLPYCSMEQRYLFDFKKYDTSQMSEEEKEELKEAMGMVFTAPEQQEFVNFFTCIKDIPLCITDFRRIVFYAYNNEPRPRTYGYRLPELPKPHRKFLLHATKSWQFIREHGMNVEKDPSTKAGKEVAKIQYEKAKEAVEKAFYPMVQREMMDNENLERKVVREMRWYVESALEGPSEERPLEEPLPTPPLTPPSPQPPVEFLHQLQLQARIPTVPMMPLPMMEEAQPEGQSEDFHELSILDGTRFDFMMEDHEEVPEYYVENEIAPNLDDPLYDPIHVGPELDLACMMELWDDVGMNCVYDMDFLPFLPDQEDVLWDSSLETAYGIWYSNNASLNENSNGNLDSNVLPGTENVPWENHGIPDEEWEALGICDDISVFEPIHSFF